MKNLASIFVLSVILLSSTLIFGQTTVTGHVFAEVVESVSASSQSQTNFNIQRNQTGSINFGQIEIKSAESASCSLILGKANFTDNNHQSMTMETSAFSSQSPDANSINGYQSVNLQLQPDPNTIDLNSTQYQGDINIVLAYN